MNTNDTLEMGQAAASQNLNRTMATVKDGVAQATASMQQAQSQAQTAMRETMEKSMKSMTDMVSFAKGNFEAFASFGQIMSAGLQDMSQTLAASSKASAEDAMNTMKALGSVKSIKEAMDLQSALIRSTMEQAVSQSAKLTDASMKLSERAFAPLTARMSIAAETFSHN